MTNAFLKQNFSTLMGELVNLAKDFRLLPPQKTTTTMLLYFDSDQQFIRPDNFSRLRPILKSRGSINNNWERGRFNTDQSQQILVDMLEGGDEPTLNL